MRRRKKNQDSGEDFPSSPAWLATYGDLMTLLMCFFVLIMSFSTIELDKFKLAMGSLQGALGIMGTQKNLKPEQTLFSSSQNNLQNLFTLSVLDHVEKLREMLEQQGLKDRVDLFMSDNELHIKIKEEVLFDLGSAELYPQSYGILSFVAKTLFIFSDEIKVEGHTDNLPIHTERYPSNWELSFDRALNVIKYFINQQGVDPAKLSVSGYGEFRPLVPNDSPDNRAKNRRVVIKVRWKTDEFIQ
ncbi:MAG TPA: flagellar motor protein MotB [bacterium]